MSRFWSEFTKVEQATILQNLLNIDLKYKRQNNFLICFIYTMMIINILYQSERLFHITLLLFPICIVKICLNMNKFKIKDIKTIYKAKIKVISILKININTDTPEKFRQIIIEKGLLKPCKIENLSLLYYLAH